MSRVYDTIVIGAGAAGMMAAISSAREGKSVLLLEKLPKVGAKLKATGGGRCNLANTLPNDEFISSFGKDGRFITPALEAMDYKKLQEFFAGISVETHAPDGFHIFPVGHSSSTIISALTSEMDRLGVEVLCSQRVERLEYSEAEAKGVTTKSDTFYSNHVILSTGGMGYPTLGAEGDGYSMVETVGHTTSLIFPAMMPLKTRETWVANCRADTIAKAHLRVDMKKYKKLNAIGDLIFTKSGIRGPVVLDFSREITPILSQLDEVPILINMTKGMNEEDIRQHIKAELQKDPHRTTLQLLSTLLSEPITKELCILSEVNHTQGFNKLSGVSRDKLIRLLAWTPLTITGHDGFDMAMITRGGIKLNEIDSHTLESKKLKGLYLCGEVVDIDGPCGGYNLQWAFASGHLAGMTSKANYHNLTCT